jgi:hypothetical protein
VIRITRWVFPLVLAACPGTFCVQAQIDPVNRELIQLGYNAAFEGHAPLSLYAFYYRNKPEFLSTNLTLRTAVAPTYLDAELGISQALGEHTDLGFGLAGGGFADSYTEVQQGKYLPEQSFSGYGAEVSASIYHLFNPGQLIPLNGVLRGIAHYSTYERTDDTAKNFLIPDDRGTFSVRTGLRWGGREPTLFPSLAMELSLWYQGEFRTDSDYYGYNDRFVQRHSHLFWAEAYLAYELPELKHSFSISLTAGSSADADRFSTYRLGSLLPLASEFPLSIPGYYYQEISAQQFVLFGGNYIVPLEEKQRWNVVVDGAAAVVDYLPGLEQPGNFHSGVGGGLLYKTSSWRVMLNYGYGFEAIRSHGRGANSLGILVQLDWGQAKGTLFNPSEPGHWRGLQEILGVIGK